MVDINPNAEVQPDRNWVIAASALKFVRDGIAPYVDYHIQKNYESAVKSVFNECPSNANYLTDSCTRNNLLPAHKPSQCPCRFKEKCFCRKPFNRRLCPNHFCSLFYDKIVADHVFSDPKWENSDPSRWSQDYWDYAKCFIPTLEDQQVHSAENSELLSLINICLNHRQFQQTKGFLSEYLRKCRVVRNQIFHSRSMQITDEQLQEYIDVMKRLLQSLNWPSADIAVRKLFELQEGKVLSLADYEAEAKETATKEVGEVTKLTLEEIRSTTLRLLQEQNPDSSWHSQVTGRKSTERNEAALLEAIAQRILKDALQNSGVEADRDRVRRNVQTVLGELTDSGIILGEHDKGWSETNITETNQLFHELLDKKLLQTETDDVDSGVPDSKSETSNMHPGSVISLDDQPLCASAQDKYARPYNKNERLMNMEELKNLMLTEGKTSPVLIEKCDQICQFIKQQQPLYIINVWPGYMLEDSNEIVFIVLSKEKIDLELSWKVQIRFFGQGNEKSKRILYHKDNCPLTKEMEKKVCSVIDKYSGTLMQKHTFLSAISASSVMYQKQESEIVVAIPCIVFYVLIKSAVFLTEETFPKELDGVPVDVREGVFRLCGSSAEDFHDKLRMGCKITSSVHPYKHGTLGGFIEHPEYGLCGFTCAHICLNEHDMFELKKQKIVEEFQQECHVFQPEKGVKNKIGRLVKLIYKEGNNQETGLDVAMFKIEKRAPVEGNFPDKNGIETGILNIGFLNGLKSL